MIGISRGGLVSCVGRSAAAAQHYNPALRSLSCAFCGTQLVVKDEPAATITSDRFIIPFAFDQNRARSILGGLIKNRGIVDFAPRDVLSTSQYDEGIGAYLPFWHYACSVLSNWTGRCGQTQYRTDIGSGKRRACNPSVATDAVYHLVPDGRPAYDELERSSSHPTDCYLQNRTLSARIRLRRFDRMWRTIISDSSPKNRHVQRRKPGKWGTN